MKKYAKSCKAILASAGWLLLATQGHAVFTTVGTVNTNTAEVTTGGGVVQMTPTILTVAANAAASEITWTNVTIPTAWKVADDYILLNATVTLAGGIQTYTDNTATDANPKFTGDKTVTTPAGLIDAVDTTKKLPTAWTIRHSTGTVPAVEPNLPAGFNWFYHEDKAQVAVPSANAAAFSNGASYVTVQNVGGINYAQPGTFGAPPTGNPALSDFHNALYIEANFTGAVGGRNYKTSTLRVEAFTE